MTREGVVRALPACSVPDMPDAGFQEVLWPDRRRGPWLVRIEWGVVDGRIECVGLHLQQVPDTPLKAFNTSVLRSIPLGSLVEEARGRHIRSLRKLQALPAPRELRRRAAEQLESFQAGKKGKGGPRLQYGAEHLAQVAEVYLKSANKPTTAVAQHFKVPYSTAAKWVARARRIGVLAPTTKGKAGGSFPPEIEGQ